MPDQLPSDGSRRQTVNQDSNTYSFTGVIRKYVHFDSELLPNIFVLKGSVIELAVAAQQDSADGVPNITLNWFDNLTKCRCFEDEDGARPNKITHLQLRDSGHLFHNYSNYSVGSEEGEYVCVVMELSPGFNYTLTITGTTRQFRDATSLHNDINTRCVQYSRSVVSVKSSEGMNFTLNRSWKSRSSARSQKTCVLFTLQHNSCQYSCNLNLDAVLYYTPENVSVATLSAWGVLSLLSLSAFLIVSVVIRYKH